MQSICAEPTDKELISPHFADATEPVSVNMQAAVKPTEQKTLGTVEGRKEKATVLGLAVKKTLYEKKMKL